MPNDYYANKVVFGNTTIMDISDTTASPEDVAEGEIFYAANGARSVGTGTGYELPIASANTLGGIKVGSNLSIDNNGVLSAEGAVYSEGDGIDIEGTTISLDIDYLTASRLGLGTAATKNAGESNGVATLDINGKVPSSQLPTIDSLEAIDISQSSYDALPSTDKNDPLKIYFVGENDGKYMTPMSWGGSVDTYGYNIWSDGTNIYYSGGVDQYKLNGTIWEPITWTGLTDFYGNAVWTDGTNIYYSDGSTHCKLNGTTWETMTWSGYTGFNGRSVWTDGTDIYYSFYYNQYKLNGTTWESMSWSGLTLFIGYNIWSDGTDVYYSQSGNQKKLNGTTWENVTWTGLTNFEGQYVWTDGVNIYFSLGSSQYKLNSTTWESITWEGFTNFNGQDIWTDGDNTYCSSGTDQYRLADLYSADGIYYKDNNYVKPAYELPIASASTLGGVKVGSGLSIDANGVLSSTGGGGGSYTAGDGIDIENTTISLDIDYLTASRLGVIPTTEKGTNNGVATLDNSGKVPSSQLPSYVDDVLEYADLSSFPVTGESGKIYVALDTNKTYRWSGSAYVEISASLALGETTGTAYEGNKGKANADNIATIQGLIPSGASTSNKLATTNDIPSTTNFVQKSATPGLLKNDGSIDTNTYLTELPIASSNALGGIRVGNNLSIDENGILSAIGGGGSGAVDSVNNKTGVVVLDATDINLEVPIEMLSGTKLTVESALDGLNREKTTPIELTQAEYNALTDQEKHDITKMYYITDVINPTPGLLYEQNVVTTTYPLHAEHGINRLIKYSSLNIVVLDLILDRFSISAWNAIGTIPEGYRPKSRIRIASAHDSETMPFDITADGHIVSSASLTNAEVWLHGFWFIG